LFLVSNHHAHQSLHDYPQGFHFYQTLRQLSLLSESSNGVAHDYPQGLREQQRKIKGVGRKFFRGGGGNGKNKTEK